MHLQRRNNHETNRTEFFENIFSLHLLFSSCCSAFPALHCKERLTKMKFCSPTTAKNVEEIGVEDNERNRTSIRKSSGKFAQKAPNDKWQGKAIKTIFVNSFRLLFFSPTKCFISRGTTNFRAHYFK